MEIVGEKVVLRAAEVQDQEMLRNLIEDPDITKITRGYQRPAALFRQMSCFRIPQGSKGNLCRIVADKQCPQTGLSRSPIQTRTGNVRRSRLNLENPFGAKATDRMRSMHWSCLLLRSFGWTAWNLIFWRTIRLQENCLKNAALSRYGYKKAEQIGTDIAGTYVLTE